MEKENDKRQIELFNEYLQLRKERDEQNKDTDLPSLLPLLVSRPKNKDKDKDSYDDDEEEEKQEDEKKNNNYKKKMHFRGPPTRRRMRNSGNGSYGKNYNNGMKKRGGYVSRFRGRRYKKGYYS